MKKKKKGSLKPKPALNGKIFLHTKNKDIFILFQDILYIEANRGYANIHCKNHPSELCTKPLGTLEKELPEYYFIRCHRSYIVNTEEVRSVDRIKKEILLSDNSIIPISHLRCRNVIKFLIGNNG